MLHKLAPLTTRKLFCKLSTENYPQQMKNYPIVIFHTNVFCVDFAVYGVY